MPDLIANPPQTASAAPSRKAGPAFTEGTQSIQRAIAVLREIACHTPRGMRLADIATTLEIERATAHRIMKGLSFHGMAVRDPRTNHYRLGPTVHALGLATTPHYTLAEVCEPTLTRLAEATGDSTFLLVRSGYDAVCLRRMEGSFPLQAHTLDTGVRRPLGGGGGALALLMALPDAEIDHIIEANARRMQSYRDLSPARLRAAIARSREVGYAINDEQLMAGVSAIGMTIPTAHGMPYVAISVASATSRMKVRAQEIVQLLAPEVAQLGRLLANQPPWV